MSYVHERHRFWGVQVTVKKEEELGEWEREEGIAGRAVAVGWL